MIRVNNLSKEFRNGKGVFDLDFHVSKGEVFGFIGPNGAGKSTTIRHLMGFLKPQKGNGEILGMDCWKDAKEIKAHIGYLPGEIVFPTGMSAREIIKLQENMNGVRGKSRSDELIRRFELNTSIPIKKMSKGMKQKLAIVVAFLSDPEIIILDEPSTGLDPIMQKTFIQLLQEEKKRGKTVLLSSHIFSEIEDVADTICIIKDGRIVEYQKYSTVQESMKPVLCVTFENSTDIENITASWKARKENSVDFQVDENIGAVLKEISQYKIKSLDVHKISLTELFEKYYKDSDL